MQYPQNQSCCGSNASVNGWSYCGCGNQYPVVPGTNPALQTWNGQNFVVADGSAQNRISLPFLQVNGGVATYVVGADNNGVWSYYNPAYAGYANNINGGAAGQVPWQSAPSVTGFTATGTSGQLLQSGGTGSPTWIAPNNLLVTATGSTTARTLANRFAEVANVKDFGAVGDGVTDDTAAFQAALNSGSNKVYIPPTTSSYLVGTLVMPTITGFVLEGSGSAGTIKQKAGSVITWPTRATGVLYPVQTVYNLNFDGSAGTDHIVNTSYVGNVKFFNCTVRNIPTNYSAFYVNGNPTDGTYTHDIYFNYCDIINNTSFAGSGSYGLAGIQLAETAADIEINGYTFNGNFITQNALAIQSGCGSVRVEGGHIYNTISPVVAIYSPVDVVRFIGTGFDNSQSDIVHAEGCNGLSIDSCRIQAVQSGNIGIKLVNCGNTGIGSTTFDGVAGALSAVVETGSSDYTIVSYPVFTSITTFSEPFNLISSTSFVRGAYRNNLMGYFVSFPFCGQTNLTAGSTVFLGPNGQQSAAANNYFVVPTDGLLDSCTVECSTAPGAGQSYTVTLAANGTTIATGTISGASQFLVNLTIPANTSIAKGTSYLTLQVVSSAGAAATIIRGFISMTA